MSNRRKFLKQTGAAVIVLGAETQILGTGIAMPEARRQEPIRVGSGDHTYECVHDWLTPPPNIQFGDTQGVAQDAAGRIYISHTVHSGSPSDDAIVVFDRSGKFVTSWGARFKGGGHGLDIRKEGDTEYLYHCDTAHHVVVKTDLSGKVIWEKGTPAEAGVYDDKHKFTPTNVALTAGTGDFFIGDGYGSSYIHQYTGGGEYIRTFGGLGTGPGQTNTPHGLWIDTRAGAGTGGEPLLVVADRGNHRLQYFTLDGHHVSFVTKGMRQPCHFDIRGDELLVPDLDSVVTILDKDNRVVVKLGDGFVAGAPDMRGVPHSAYIPGKFIHPHSAKFLDNGDILVVEWVPIGRITLLRKVAA